MLVDIAEKVFKVRGQRSSSWPGKFTYNSGCIHFDGAASSFTCIGIFPFRRIPGLGLWLGLGIRLNGIR